jgi:hypothetical protein
MTFGTVRPPERRTRMTGRGPSAWPRALRWWSMTAVVFGSMVSQGSCPGSVQRSMIPSVRGSRAGSPFQVPRYTRTRATGRSPSVVSTVA